MKQIKIEDLSKGDVVRVTYTDSENEDGLICISIVNKIVGMNGVDTAHFKDLVALNYDEIDEDWEATDDEVIINEILFNYQPEPVEEILAKKFPEYFL